MTACSCSRMDTRGKDLKSDFSEEQLHRYSRHILLREVGVEGQLKLARARVLIVGAGGLGSPAALYLGAAGVGTLGIVDGDRVELSNLQRQIIHAAADLAKLKAYSAAESITAINPEVRVRTYPLKLAADNIADILGDYDFVIDGSDNFATKFLVNDACVLAGIPFSYGGVLRFEGQTMTVMPGQSACFRCIFRQPPPAEAVPTCSEAGILGAVAGMLGTIQAVEALKFIIGAGRLLTDFLLRFDALSMDFRKIGIKRQAQCPVCGLQPLVTRPVDLPPAGCSR